ncbi:MAG: hypothetical protein KBH11_08605 [Bacteroidia bacterium]|jgi:hypothetical protein|nr:hypothetical protein [Bacteroidia bacterium]
MNREKKAAPAPTPEKKKAPGKGMASARKYVRFLNVFNMVKRDMVVQAMPYIFFMTVIALVYIANSYYAENTIREIDKINKELKTLKSEGISASSELMIRSKQSEVARAVAPIGLVESTDAARKIVVKTSANETRED